MDVDKQDIRYRSVEFRGLLFRAVLVFLLAIIVDSPNMCVDPVLSCSYRDRQLEVQL